VLSDRRWCPLPNRKEALAPYLGVSVDEFRRRAGVVPITVGVLTPDETVSYTAALQVLLHALS